MKPKTHSIITTLALALALATLPSTANSLNSNLTVPKSNLTANFSLIILKVDKLKFWHSGGSRIEKFVI